MERSAHGTEFDSDDLAQLRDRLRRMTLEELVKFGRVASEMCRPSSEQPQPPQLPFRIQLEEARAEYRRRKTNRECTAGSRHRAQAL
jgi:hypothetical protein